MKIVENALKLGACNKIANIKDIPSLVELFYSPQGREFCIENKYPSLKTFREMDLEEYGIYTDKKVEVENKNVTLVNSYGKLTFNRLDQVYIVVLMHGAKADIYASNYAVVLVEGKGAKITTDLTAKVL